MPTTTQENLIKVVNPSSGEVISTVSYTQDVQIEKIVDNAKEAFLLWKNLSVEKRIEYLKKIYEVIINDKNNIAKTITQNNGKPLTECYLTEIASTLQVMEYFIKHGSELLGEKNIPLGPIYPMKKSSLAYEPYGVVAIIEPWNYPFYIPFSAITKALITGNTFVFKPSSTVSLVGKLIEEILLKANLPPHVTNIIYGNGTTAEILINSDIDMVVFTGSVNVGKKIAAQCIQKLLPMCLELGGKDPAIVLKNCNIDYAAGGVLWGALTNCGQACASIERVYVDSSIHDEFVEKISKLASELKIGDGLSDDTDIGPLVNEEQLNKVKEHIADALSQGAKLHIGGKQVNRSGYFFEPTVLSNVTHNMKVMKEETFGPIIPIMKFDTVDEAIFLANDTRYGLSASVWSSEIEGARKIVNSLNCGTVWVNDSLFLQAHPACPWIGYKDSGYGNSSIYQFVKTKHISIDQGYIPSIRPKSFWWYPYKGKSKSYSDLIEIVFKTGLKNKAKATFQALVDLLK